jgi:hypothetical protein
MRRVALAFGLMLPMLAAGNLSPSGVALARQAGAATASANPADVSSIGAVLNAAYDVISGPAEKKRDWDRFRSLFIPEARFIIAAPAQSGGVGARVFDIPAFISGFDEFVGTNGFFERDVARRTERYGNIAHVFSTYESRRNAGDAKPFARGINSFQLLNDGKRWWIVDIYWQEESPGNPIPKKYLTGGRRE